MKTKHEAALHGKIVLITGAASGMGECAAREFSRCGARVAALDINAAGLDERTAGHENITPWPVDITDTQALETVVNEVTSRLGPIDRVYNAAGIMPLGRLLEQKVETIHRLMSVNFGGLVNIAKLTVPGMLERGQGAFVHFASMAGWLPTLLTGGYCASKFAGVAFMEVLYHENLNQGVRFACICPPLGLTTISNSMVPNPVILGSK